MSITTSYAYSVPLLTLSLPDVSVVSPRMGSNGWPFASVDPFPAADPDLLYSSEHVKDLYLRIKPDYDGRCVLDHFPTSFYLI